eukprot:sb/3466752/
MDQIGSSAVAVFGSISNALSLAYFITEESKGLGSRLLILLNIFDLGVCICATGCVVSNIFVVQTNTPLNTFLFLFRILLQCTAFTTCLLSVTRTICMCAPFYKLNMSSLVCGIVVFIMGVTSCQLTGLLTVTLRPADDVYIDRVNSILLNIERALMTVIFILVIICNVASVVQLSLVNSDTLAEISRRATITVFILSLFFCIFNTAFLVNLYVYGTEYELPVKIRWFSFFMAIPLNSAFNPCIYFLRKQPMREFLGHTWKRVSRRGGSAHTGVKIKIKILILSSHTPAAVKISLPILRVTFQHSPTSHYISEFPIICVLNTNID